MCFSATASFISGATLTGIGVATIRCVRKKTEMPLALIPLLFGAQQLTEGVIWLTFGTNALLLRDVMTIVYSIFSHVLWPIYVPLAIGVLEVTRWRKKVIFIFQIAGLVVGLYLAYFIATQKVVAEVVSRHIIYVSPHFFLPEVMVLYLAATCVSCFFSSVRLVNLFGILISAFFIVAYIVYVNALVSIWCFFAAILSVVIYIQLKHRRFSCSPAPPAISSS
jgi:hypothetical protein